jgi:hypothetical protein
MYVLFCVVVSFCSFELCIVCCFVIKVERWFGGWMGGDGWVGGWGLMVSDGGGWWRVGGGLVGWFVHWLVVNWLVVG